ncbi:hypothetical protein B2A_01944, partial [mine drainage metagenome]
MQGRVSNPCTPDKNRGDPCNGSERSRTADLEVDGFDDCRHLLTWKLEGDRPTGRTCDRPEPLLFTDLIHLEHGTIRFKRQLVTTAQKLTEIGETGSNTNESLKLACDREACLPETNEKRRVVLGEASLERPTDSVGGKRKRAGGGHLGIKLPQAARSRIPGIHEWPAILLFDDPVGLAESVLRQIDLAPDLESPGPVPATDPERDGPNGPDIGGHILSCESIPTGGGTNQDTLFVEKIHRQPIVLGFADVYEWDPDPPRP